MANIKVHTHTRVIGRPAAEDSKPLEVDMRDDKPKAVVTFNDEDDITIEANVADHGDTLEFEVYVLLDKVARAARARSEQKDRQIGIVRPKTEVSGEEVPVRVDVQRAPREGKRRTA